MRCIYLLETILIKFPTLHPISTRTNKLMNILFVKFRSIDFNPHWGFCKAPQYYEDSADIQWWYPIRSIR